MTDDTRRKVLLGSLAVLALGAGGFWVTRLGGRKSVEITKTGTGERKQRSKAEAPQRTKRQSKRQKDKPKAEPTERKKRERSERETGERGKRRRGGGKKKTKKQKIVPVA